ncbi:MAG TPA: hypothetical protein VNZ52_13070, partial [Candidatus Thermoplasmatota archaeon]|nr:hypothetical protein [Candidatus Thermoplasmatota archaeon]
PPPEEDPWGFLPDGDWTDNEADIQFTHTILRTDTVPLDEKIRHKGDRKVTLFELVEALEEARAEAELRRELNAKREAESTLRRQLRQTRAEGAAHKEDQEAEIQEVWRRIASLNGAPIPIKDLQHGKTREEVVKTLVSVLFLARAAKVRVWQDNFPYGPIYVRNLNPAPHHDGDGAAAAPAPKPGEGASAN